MKSKILKIYVLVALALLSFVKTYANHIIGGNIYYEFISKDSVKVYVDIYSDCSYTSTQNYLTLSLANTSSALNFIRQEELHHWK